MLQEAAEIKIFDPERVFISKNGLGSFSVEAAALWGD
jgi:hypothetical protein